MPRLSDILGPSPYPGEQGDNWSLNHPSPKGNWTDEADVFEYKFIVANNQVHMSDKDDYDQLARNAGVNPDYTGPIAMGTVHVDMGKASFILHTNMHAQGLEKILQTVAAKQGWQYGGATDMDGRPLSESKVSSLYFQAQGDKLQFAHAKSALPNLSGAIHIANQNAFVYPYRPEYKEALQQWASDTGKVLISAHDNTIKVVEDLEEKNVYSPDWNNPEDHFLREDPKDSSEPIGESTCGYCGQVFESLNALIEHQKNDEEAWDDHPTTEPALEFITVSGAATYIYSPQPYYVSLNDPNGNKYYLMNGTINFVSPFNRAIIPAPPSLALGSQNFTISVNDFTDLQGVPPPASTTVYNGPIVFGNLTNG